MERSPELDFDEAFLEFRRVSYNASKAGEELFRRDINRVGGRSLFLLIKLGLTYSDIEPNKVFNGRKVGRSYVLP